MRDIKFRAWDKDSKRMFSWEALLQLMDLIDIFVDESLELMQFTGLKDRKRTKEYPEGQEIYEGDIVKFYTGTIQFPPPEGAKVYGRKKVVFEEGMFQLGGHLLLTSGNISEVEVIGDIHTTPELLEKEK